VRGEGNAAERGTQKKGLGEEALVKRHATEKHWQKEGNSKLNQRVKNWPERRTDGIEDTNIRLGDG